MDIFSRKEYTSYYAPGQRKRVATVIAEDEHVAVGKASYGKGMKAQFHSHQGEEYIHVISGRGVFRTKSKEVTAPTGTTLRFAPGEEHQLENKWTEPLVFMFVYPVSSDIHNLRDRWVRIK